VRGFESISVVFTLWHQLYTLTKSVLGPLGLMLFHYHHHSLSSHAPESMVMGLLRGRSLVAKAPGWYPGDPGSNPGDPPLGRGKRATGIDGSVKVDSTARTLTERMGTISKPP